MCVSYIYICVCVSYIYISIYISIYMDLYIYISKYIYIYVYVYIYILFQILFPLKLLQSTEQSSLCYTVGPCWLSILNIPESTCQSQTPLYSSISSGRAPEAPAPPCAPIKSLPMPPCYSPYYINVYLYTPRGLGPSGPPSNS